MSKGKKIYFLVLILITILVTTFYFSYAIFSNIQEKHGKLNIVAGTLNYKIESSELDNDSIILVANTSKEIKIKLTSLNEVGSKYELYYILDKTNDKVSVGYSKDTKDNVLGTIEGSSSKMISIVVRNDSDTSTKVTFKVLGGLVNNELALKDGNSLNQEVALCNYEKGYVWNFDYTGGEQEFTTPCSGEYKLETWGAGGATTGQKRANSYYEGYGGYAKGSILLNMNDKLYIAVGGGLSVFMGENYNGGGAASSAAGGGATSIQNKLINDGQLKEYSNAKENVIIVSGGGGGSEWGGTSYASGGGFQGGNGSLDVVGGATGTNALGGTQVTGGNGGNTRFLGLNLTGKSGSFGQGGNDLNGTDPGAGGGGGWYGGGAQAILGNGAGGSGYIGNSLLTDKVMYCYNCSESSEESTKTISTTCTSTTPTENCSKQGNGYAKITYLGN